MEENSNNLYYYSYEIKKGDTLYQISKNYDVNTKLLAELNGLDLDDYIYPGQMILIPKKEISYYITKEGDTIKTVSQIFDTSEYNLLDENQTLYLQSGQMIYHKRN